MVNVNGIISVKIADEQQDYFRTEHIETKYGRKHYIFCEVCAPHELSMSSFWGMTEEYYNQLLQSGKLTEKVQ